MSPARSRAIVAAAAKERPLSALDLDAYLRRIAWRGPLTADRDTLSRLAAAHAAAIPFENLDPFLRRPVPLSLEAVQRKLVQEGRGGYCFEQNLLFGEVLEAIGFAVSGLSARVVWMMPADKINPRSHMVLRIELAGGTHIADVGFGGLTLTGALRLTPGIEQRTAHEPFRLTLAGEHWTVEAQIGGEWRPLYRFDLQPQHPIDYVVANHFVATHPQSIFVNGLMLARAAPEYRLALRDRDFVVHYLSGKTERRRLETTDEICAVMEREFLIKLPDAANLRSRLESLP